MIWTDAVQMAIVMGGTMAIAIIGTDKVGGSSEVWDIVNEDNRINFNKLASNLKPRFVNQLYGTILLQVKLCNIMKLINLFCNFPCLSQLTYR